MDLIANQPKMTPSQHGGSEECSPAYLNANFKFSTPMDVVL